jgi:hypothetical protein
LTVVGCTAVLIDPLSGRSSSFVHCPAEKRALARPLQLLLLLTLGMRLLAVLPRSLGMLLGVRRVLFALRVIAFAMMFGCGAMRFGRILVKFSCLIVFIFGH